MNYNAHMTKRKTKVRSATLRKRTMLEMWIKKTKVNTDMHAVEQINLSLNVLSN